MNLLFFAYNFAGGGAEKSLLTLAEALANRGHHVSIAANLKKPAYDLPKSVRFIEKDTFELMKSNSLLLIVFRKLYNFYRSYRVTKKIISDVSPDVIITFLHANMQTITLAHGRIPIISSERNTFDRVLCKREYKEKYELNKKFNKVTVLTQYDKRFIGDKLNNVVVIPNAISTSPISLNDYRDSFSKRKNILACGRLSALGDDGKLIKGFDLLIESFSIIANKFPESDLDIAGDGTEEGLLFLKDLARKKGVGERVHFLGFVKDIDNLMKSHEMYVLSSRAEGFGRVVIEAMAAGTPVVAFNCSGPSEIIENGVDGYLVEKENVKQLAEKMSIVLKDRNIRYSFGEKALNNITRFSMDQIIPLWEDLFKQVMS